MKVRISVSLWSILLVGSANPEDAPGVDYLATESEAYALLPPVPVSVPNHDILRLGWTSQPNMLWTVGVQRPKGPNRFVDYLQITSSANPRTLFLYKLGDPTAKKLMDLRTGVEVREVYASQNSDWFVVVSGGDAPNFTAVNRLTGRQVPIAHQDFYHKIITDLYPQDPLFLISQGKRDEFVVRLSRFDFQSGDWIPVTALSQEGMKYAFSDSVPEQRTIGFFFIDIAGDSGLVQIYDYAKNSFVKTVSSQEYFDLTKKPRSGRTIKWSVDTIQEDYRGQPLSAVELTNGSLTREDSPRFTIPGALYGVMSFDEKQLAYLSNRMVAVRELMPLTGKMAEEVKKAEEERNLVRLTKQIVIAIIMYAGDEDGAYPPSVGFAELVLPYLRNGEGLDKFEYQNPNKKESEIEDHFSLVLGTIKGKFGSAVGYANGSVKWIPNPK